MRLGKYAVRQIKPSTVEPIVEAMSPRASYQDVWNLQSTLMDAMLEGYSDVVFDIGGSPGYMPGYINNFYCAEWADRFPNKIRLIGNFLSDLIMDRIRCMDRLDRMESARDRWGVPVHVDQFCTNFAVDPDSSNLKWFCDQLKRRRISGMLWEWRTVWHTFGVYHLEDPNDPKSNSVIDQRRADVVREWLVA